jgi:hypothetical protein
MAANLKIRALLGTLLMLVAGTVLAVQVQYRWADSNGKIVFTDAPPNGIVYQVYRDGVPRETVYPESNEEPEFEDENELKPLYTEEEKRELGDRLLLLKYENEEQIAEDMQVELDHLQYDFRLLESESQSLTKSLHTLIRAAADSQRAQQVVDDAQRQQIEGVRERLRSNDRDLQRLQERADGIRAEFAEKLQRFRFLNSAQTASG